MKVSSQEVTRVTAQTPIIMEKAYSRCRHMITSGYEEPYELIGKSTAEIQQVFSYKDGFMVWFTEDGSLVIHQRSRIGARMTRGGYTWDFLRGR
jgi:hypothetical protein